MLEHGCVRDTPLLPCQLWNPADLPTSEPYSSWLDRLGLSMWERVGFKAVRAIN